MLKELVDGGSPLRMSQIEDFEKSISQKLPSGYMNFLVKYNGGRPRPECVLIPGHREQMLPVHYFFGIGLNPESLTLSWSYQWRRSHLSSAAVPIACSSFGDIFYIDLANNAEVRFDDYQLDGNDAIFKVADDFYSFIANFCPCQTMDD